MFVPAGVIGQQLLNAAETPYLSHSWSTSGSVAGTFTQRLGFRFSLSADITVNQLSYYQASSQGDERVIIHRVSDGATIASVDITGVTDTWVTAAISEVTLLSSETYTCSGRQAAGAARYWRRNPTGLSFESRITKTANVTGTSDAIPTTTSGNVYVCARFGYQ